METRFSLWAALHAQAIHGTEHVNRHDLVFEIMMAVASPLQLDKLKAGAKRTALSSIVCGRWVCKSLS